MFVFLLFWKHNSSSAQGNEKSLPEPSVFRLKYRYSCHLRIFITLTISPPRVESCISGEILLPRQLSSNLTLLWQLGLDPVLHCFSFQGRVVTASLDDVGLDELIHCYYVFNIRHIFLHTACLIAHQSNDCWKNSTNIRDLFGHSKCIMTTTLCGRSPFFIHSTRACTWCAPSWMWTPRFGSKYPVSSVFCKQPCLIIDAFKESNDKCSTGCKFEFRKSRRPSIQTMEWSGKLPFSNVPATEV